ncbi:MAG: AAA family ATPase [Acidimicrobiales bacterium]
MASKPVDVYDRGPEWGDLEAFASSDGPGLQVAIVYGRRRQGKSYLLRRLARVTGGFYYQALEEEAAPALEHLGRAVGQWLHVPGSRLAFDDWTAAVDALVQLARGGDVPVLAVIDEFPYVLDRVPELSSILQRAVDSSRDGEGGPVRLILCGSALSVMTEVLSGQRALRGRVRATVAIEPFDYRDAAAYWGLEGEWELAVRLHAILGGTPGYRDQLGLGPPTSVDGLGEWLAAGVCNPASSMFREDDYLLAEERGLNDRALYHSVLAAIASGNRTETKMAAALGREPPVPGVAARSPDRCWVRGT